MMRSISRERRVAARRKRLLDERDARPGAGFEMEGKLGFRPGLVGVDDQRCSRRGGADGGDPRRVARPASLIFSRGRQLALAAAAAISCGLATEMVKAVVAGPGRGSPASA